MRSGHVFGNVAVNQAIEDAMQLRWDGIDQRTIPPHVIDFFNVAERKAGVGVLHQQLKSIGIIDNGGAPPLGLRNDRVVAWPDLYEVHVLSEGLAQAVLARHDAPAYC